MILAIDTSTELAGLALWEDGALVAECTWLSGRSHTGQLLPRLSELQRLAGASIERLSGVAVAVGPGSFTGLRVGITTAKTLAWSLRLPLAGVPTLEAMAYAHSAAGLPVYPIMDAGRGDVYTAMFQRTGVGWRQLAPYQVSKPSEVWASVRERTLFCGDTEAVRSAMKGSKVRAVFASGAANVRRPSLVAELGLLAIERGELADPSLLQPLYLRRPPAEERLEDSLEKREQGERTGAGAREAGTPTRD